MKKSLKLALFLSGIAPLPAMAHVDYTGQDFGTFTGLGTASNTLANRTVDGHYGWADAADADWGDSHKGRFLKFTLDHAANVTVSVQSNTLTPNAQGGVFLPGFSLYEGLAPYLAHDYSDAAFAWRDTQTPPAATEGYWNALGSFQAANDAGETGFLTFKGYAVDGTFANFGNATTMPGVTGDGAADGLVSKTFDLGAGTYSLVVGGATYDGAGTNAGNRAYGFGATLAVAPITAPIPEPETYAMLLAGLGLVGAVARRRKSSAKGL